jgi:hypothetical protein
MRGAAALLLLAVAVVAGAAWGVQWWANRISKTVKQTQLAQERDAQATVRSWADGKGQEPFYEDYRLAYQLPSVPEGLESDTAMMARWLQEKKNLDLLNDALQSEGVGSKDVEALAGMKAVIARLQRVAGGAATRDDLAVLGIVGDRLPGRTEAEKDDYIREVARLSKGRSTLAEMRSIAERVGLLVPLVYEPSVKHVLTPHDVAAALREGLPSDLGDRAEEFANRLLGLKKPDPEMTLGGLLSTPAKFFSESRPTSTQGESPAQSDEGQAWLTFAAAIASLKSGTGEWPKQGNATLTISARPPKLVMVTATSGTWSFTATKTETREGLELRGPSGSDEHGKGNTNLLGRLSTDQNGVSLELERAAIISGYVPLVCEWKEKKTEPFWFARPRRSRWGQGADTTVADVVAGQRAATMSVTDLPIGKECKLVVHEIRGGVIKGGPLHVEVTKQGLAYVLKVCYGEGDGDVIETMTWRWKTEKTAWSIERHAESIEDGKATAKAEEGEKPKPPDEKAWQRHVENVIKQMLGGTTIPGPELRKRIGLEPASDLKARENGQNRNQALINSARRQEQDMSPWPECFTWRKGSSLAAHDAAQARSETTWLNAPVDYLLENDSPFQRWCLDPTRPLSFDSDHSLVDAFLTDESQAEWVKSTQASFNDKKQRTRADQNALLALRVVASDWGEFKAKSSRLLLDRVRELQIGRAFKETRLGDLVEVTLAIEWDVADEKVVVPVAEVSGVSERQDSGATAGSKRTGQ